MGEVPASNIHADVLLKDMFAKEAMWIDLVNKLRFFS